MHLLASLTQLVDHRAQGLSLPPIDAPLRMFCYWIMEGSIGTVLGVLFLVHYAALHLYGFIALVILLLVAFVTGKNKLRASTGNK